MLYSSTLYLPHLPPLTAVALQQAHAPERVAGYDSLPPSLQAALVFAWQWVHGHERFTLTTSGSTGPPKTIEASRQQMLVSVALTRQALGLTSQHTSLLCLNAAYIGGTMMIARSLQLGMDMQWVPPVANPLVKLSPPPDFIAVVPLQLETILRETPHLLEGIHAILVGGAPIRLALEEAIRTRVTAPVYSTYGMTETLSHIALRRLNGSEASADFRVLGDTHIDTDERGCLTIQGKITRHQRIVTNDLVAITAPQRFRWQGRYDWVINSGGVKVSSEEVARVAEQKLNQAGSSPRFFVIGLPDERLGERVVLVVEGEPAPEEEQQRLLQSMAAEVPRYHAPKEIHYFRQFVETSSGKIDRRATIAQVSE